MALQYGTRLMTAPDSPPQERVLRTAETIGQWAAIRDPLTPGEHRDPRGRSVVIDRLGEESDPLWAWRFRMNHPDKDDEALLWSVSVVAIAEADDVEVIARLDLTRREGPLARRTVRPEPPRCVSMLLERDDLRFLDGGRTLRSETWFVPPDEADELAALALDPTRHLPIFAFTPRDEETIDGHWMCQKLPGLAHVVLLSSAASWALDEALPDGCNVYGGGARIWWPGLAAGSSRYEHQLWTADKQSRTVTGQAVNAILDAGRTASLNDHRLLALENDRRLARARQLERDLQAARTDVDRVRSDRASEEERDRAEAAARQAADLLVADLQGEVEDALAQAIEFERQAEELEQRERVLRAKVLYLESEVQRLVDERSEAGELPGRGLEDEIRRIIEELGDVDGAMPRPFRLGSKFESTLQNQGPTIREQALRTCAELVVASPGLLSQREDHPLRTGSGANDPPVTRSDGAEARRAYVQKNAPAARRVHYWQLADRSIELASVNVHDDMNIPTS